MKIAACVEYDGSGFCGWQVQLGVRTVQECVERAFSRVADHDVRVVCAGRTDTGVHATGQIVHFETDSQRAAHNWVLGANSFLSKDVSVIWSLGVDETFHARFSARSRRYRYVILNRAIRPAILNTRVSWFRKPLDTKLMQQAADIFVGEHDFSSFRSYACQAKSPVRTIHSITITRSGSFVYIDIHANAFLHHMVRNIAGVLMAVACGERSSSWVSDLLEVCDRTEGGVTASPDGLYLVQVEYDPAYGLPETVELPRYT